MEPTPSGTKVVTEHREFIDTEGKRFLIKDREINIYEKIQASREQTEIENILRRAAEGDMNVLNMVNGSYMDIVDAPKSLAEAQQFIIKAKAEFDSLPKEIRQKFENNAENYVATYGTEQWADATGLKAKWEKEEAAAKQEKLNEETMQKAFENIANGGMVNNE